MWGLCWWAFKMPSPFLRPCSKVTFSVTPATPLRDFSVPLHLCTRYNSMWHITGTLIICLHICVPTRLCTWGQGLCCVHLCSPPTAWHNRHLLNEWQNEFVRWRQWEKNKSETCILGWKTGNGRKRGLYFSKSWKAQGKKFSEPSLLKLES